MAINISNNNVLIFLNVLVSSVAKVIYPGSISSQETSGFVDTFCSFDELKQN